MKIRKITDCTIFTFTFIFESSFDSYDANFENMLLLKFSQKIAKDLEKEALMKFKMSQEEENRNSKISSKKSIPKKKISQRSSRRVFFFEKHINTENNESNFKKYKFHRNPNKKESLDKVV